jgi:PAS domain S-box-containing protein
MEPTTFNSLLRRTVVVPVLALAIVAASLLLGIQSLKNSLQWVDHSDRVIGGGHQLIKLITDMESSVRGYLSSGNEEFLQPYNAAKPAVDSKFIALNQLISDNPDQQARLAGIRRRFDEWQSYQEHRIELRRSTNTRLEASLQGKRFMDAVRAEHDAFIATEERLRTERVQRSQQNARRLTITCVLLTLFVGGILAIFTRQRMHILAADFQKSLDTAEQRSEALRESKQRLDLAVEVAGLGEWELDLRDHTASRGLRHDQIFGYPSRLPEWTYEMFLDHVLPEHRAEIDQKFKAALVGGVWDFETQIRRADGEVCWIWARGRCRTDETGQPVQMFGTVMDITERKQASENLRKQAELIDLAHDSILVRDLDGAIRFWNRGAEEMYGYSKQEVAGKIAHHLLRTIFPKPLAEIEAEVLRAGRWDGELIKFTQDGTRVEVSSRWVVQRDDSGQASGVMEISNDISERKRAELALRASEHRWSTTLRSIGDAVVATDAVGNIQFMNDVAERLTGWSLPEASGKHLSAVFNIMQEATRLVPESPVAKVLRSGKVVALANHTVLIHRDGTEVPIEDSAAPIRDSSGRIEGVVLVFHDVVEQRKAEKALRISDRLATTGKLAATIAHEIHNPLDAVSNLLYLITQGTQENSTRQYASAASSELVRITQMTQRMLAFQREAAAPVPVKIRDIIESVADLYERKIKSANIELKQEIDFNDSILALPGELRQIIANLVGNAIEAVASRRGTITLRAYPSRDWRQQRPGLRVVVADNGPGIPAEVRARIFEPFFTTKGESGTGLGLWIASEILRKYAGTLHVRTSTRPHSSGACFSIFLPFETVGDGALTSGAHKKVSKRN